jgi:hypothetical protein
MTSSWNWSWQCVTETWLRVAKQTKLPLHHWHTLVIVTDTHQHIDRGLYTYMTSYLVQAYRLSILIDKPTLFINSWLIRLWVDNVLLINTRRLSIVIDKTIPLSIGTSSDNQCTCVHVWGTPRPLLEEVIIDEPVYKWGDGVGLYGIQSHCLSFWNDTLFRNLSLLWIDKARDKDKIYVWVSVRWKTKN